MKEDMNTIQITHEETIDVMIDLETLGLFPGCPILSIGAVVFGPGKAHVDSVGGDTHFYMRAKKEQAPLVPLQETIDWWARQSLEANEEAFCGTEDIVSMLAMFANHLSRLAMQGRVRVWGNAASFDLKILEHAYKTFGMQTPWKYYNEMCYRTLKNLFPQIPSGPFEGIKHSALADAVHQAKHADTIFIHLVDRDA